MRYMAAQKLFRESPGRPASQGGKGGSIGAIPQTAMASWRGPGTVSAGASSYKASRADGAGSIAVAAPLLSPRPRPQQRKKTRPHQVLFPRRAQGAQQPQAAATVQQTSSDIPSRSTAATPAGGPIIRAVLRLPLCGQRERGQQRGTYAEHLPAPRWAQRGGW